MPQDASPQELAHSRLAFHHQPNRGEPVEAKVALSPGSFGC
jgi:hypothetical protein